MTIYEFEYQHGEANAYFEVDREKFTAEIALEILNFWSWSWDKDNDPVDEAMKKIGMRAIREATSNGYNTFGVIREFDNMEGFPRLDGSLGITLTDVQEYEFNEDDLEMIKIEK